MEKTSKTRAAATRRCPVCGGESWRIVYGLVVFNDEEERPKAEYAGCCIVEEIRENAATGELEVGAAKWACQNEDCQHRWW